MESNSVCNTPQKLVTNCNPYPKSKTPEVYTIRPSPCSNVIDPECLSPLTIPRSPLDLPRISPFQKYSNKKEVSPSSHTLSVKAFRVPSEKNEGDYSPLFDEDLRNTSNSTMAESPLFSSSTQKKNLLTRSRFACLKLEAIPDFKTAEDTAARELQENNNEESSNENDLANVHETASQNISGALSAIENPSQNTENTQEQLNQGTEEENNFSDSLDFLMKKTPILKVFLMLISLSLLSGTIIGILEDHYTYRSLFIIIYVLLAGMLTERIFSVYKASSLGLRADQNEALYTIFDLASLLSIVVVANLRLSDTINSLHLGSSVCMAILLVYSLFSRLTWKKKLVGILFRALFIIQFLVVVQKLENNLSISWKVILCSGWLVIGFYTFKLIQGIGQVFLAFNNQNTILSRISKTSKIVSLIGLTLLTIDLIVLMFILFGVCQVLDYNQSSDYQYLNFYLTICQYLNASLLFFSTIAGTDLLEFTIIAVEYFGYGNRQAEPIIEKNLVQVEQRTFVKRVSTNYYKILTETEIKQSKQKEFEQAKNEQKEEHEENMCYICCGKEANGLVVDCGHGGICFDCLSDYIKQKDNCMECRRKIETVLKLEDKKLENDILTGSEIYKIIRTEKPF